MFANRIQPSALSKLCERVGVAFDVGLDPHRVFEREADNSSRDYAKKMQSVADHVSKGGSLADAIKAQGNYFPAHFGDMVEGGEKSGRLDRVLNRLADYYQQLADFRSTFLNSILWPMVQLILAAVVIGLMIYLPEVMLPSNSDANRDLIGIGLVGARGIKIYLCILAGIAGTGFALYLLARNGYFGFLVDWGGRLPMIGKTLRVFAEARFVQTLALGIESGLDAATAVDLSFRSAGTPMFVGKGEAAKKSILQGKELHRVLDDAKVFQKDTIEVVELGEESGRLAETLDKHFRHLKSQVTSAMAKITYLASGLIWFCIAAILIMIIFRVFSLYINNLGDTAVDVMNMQQP